MPGYGTVMLYGTAIGHEALTATGAVSITRTVYQPTSGLYKGMQAKQALVTVEAFTARMRVDGTTVTATTGHEIPVDGSYVIQGITNLANASFIDTASGASTIRITAFA